MMLLPVPLAPERVSGFEYLGWRHMPGIDPNGVGCFSPGQRPGDARGATCPHIHRFAPRIPRALPWAETSDPVGVEYSPTPNFPARLEFSLEGVR